MQEPQVTRVLLVILEIQVLTAQQAQVVQLARPVIQAHRADQAIQEQMALLAQVVQLVQPAIQAL